MNHQRFDHSKVPISRRIVQRCVATPVKHVRIRPVAADQLSHHVIGVRRGVLGRQAKRPQCRSFFVVGDFVDIHLKSHGREGIVVVALAEREMERRFAPESLGTLLERCLA